ncbi:pentapeptide repeat-containing protein [Streptosporangium sp. OZ121]|uniref:pentapeptide repeat-containing protein n=1 Tax=Streptosporangium sp. OZ121 TaxID=3444183 RepID=UPI003F7A7264
MKRLITRSTSFTVDLVANPDEPTPIPPGKIPRKAAPGQGLRLAQIGPTLALALTVSTLLSASLFVGALWLLGFPALTPVGQQGLSLTRLLDLLKLSFAVVAGVGGVIALVVAYRKQKVTEAAERRQQAAELRADEAHQREATKLFNERFATAANHLGHDSPAVRLAGVHALAGLADDAPTRELRQTMIDVLCAYLRMPYAPDPGDHGNPAERLAFAGLREVRHTIIRVITTHLRKEAATSWQRHNFDFTGVVFDGGDFTGAEFSGSTIDFGNAVFSDGAVTFGDARFSGGMVIFDYAKFSGGTVIFDDAVFSGSAVGFNRAMFLRSAVSFNDAKFSGGEIDFNGAKFSGGTVTFNHAEFSGGTIDFREAKFSSSTIDFGDAQFSGGTVTFDYAKFSGGKIGFDSAHFSGGTVTFGDARFSGGMIIFDYAKFSGGMVDFRKVRDWSHPPGLPNPVPTGVLLPDRLSISMLEASAEGAAES